ncbi:MAG: glutamine-hydrolyzing carbamoyl-phosphate synthase small subunit [Dehalococcoidia bacterium]
MFDKDKKIYLVLEDGTSFSGKSFGSQKEIVGEVVFNTSMTGYQEMLTDPSYAGQILMPTYPMIGNYGVNRHDIESAKIQVKGFIISNLCEYPSHPMSEGTIREYLEKNDIPGIYDLDTRAIARKLRNSGVMMGILTNSNKIDEVVAKINRSPRYGEFDVVSEVTTSKIYEWKISSSDSNKKSFIDLRNRTKKTRKQYKIVLFDFGVKFNILRSLFARNCSITIVPKDTSLSEVINLKPDGIVLSPGPGNPQFLDESIDLIRSISGSKPILGICLGHQLIGRAFGANTFKLPFGHRGGNQPIREISTGKVYVTAQNHGYALDSENLSQDVSVSHININDNTVAGLISEKLKILSIQYHSEASPGPHDSEYIFDKFIQMLDENQV